MLSSLSVHKTTFQLLELAQPCQGTFAGSGKGLFPFWLIPSYFTYSFIFFTNFFIFSTYSVIFPSYSYIFWWHILPHILTYFWYTLSYFRLLSTYFSHIPSYFVHIYYIKESPNVTSSREGKGGVYSQILKLPARSRSGNFSKSPGHFFEWLFPRMWRHQGRGWRGVYSQIVILPSGA